MQPNPRADTLSPLFPNSRLFMIVSTFLLRVRGASLQHPYFSKPVLNFFPRLFCPGIFQDQILSISFRSSPDGEALQHRGVRTHFLNGLKAATRAICPICVEWDNCFPLEVVLAQEALNRRRQLHSPSRKLHERQISSQILSLEVANSYCYSL
jgi:hypothetical protein